MSAPAPVRRLTSAEKLALCSAEVTLNGEPAAISGVRAPFAKVTSRVTGLSAEFAWTTVERIVAKGARFTT